MKGFLGWSWLSNDYKDIWNKVGNIIKKELDCKPIYTNFIFEKKKEKKEKKEKRYYSDEATDFPDRKMPEACSSYLRWSAILLLLFRKMKTIINKYF